MKCRHCGSALRCDFLDLGFAPPSNAYLTAADLSKPEVYFPLRLKVCEECWLVQTEDYASAESLFSAEYAYFSSASRSWLAHAARYVETITTRLGLGQQSMVIEVASNDGYLLKNFVAANIPCLGIEPTASTAEAAEALGIPVLREFFGEALGKTLADEGRSADLILGNNVYAHVPDINDFTRGLKAALKPGGTITLEFPHLMRLIEQNQFDTVYHEHFSYLSLFTVGKIFESAGLRVFDVEELPTHGGSLRIFGCHADDPRQTTDAIGSLLTEEERRSLRTAATYAQFQVKAEQVKNDALAFLLQARREGKTVAAYGAAAKGNTLLNFAGVKPDLLSFVCDAAAAKQDKFMPGSHIPILHPDVIFERRPDYVMILPWNIAAEVRQQLASLSEQGTKFVTAVPHLEIR
ncbi:class I SAM-dependent methyltransferase [Neorhizobium petrolearium]|uniref:Class I SAM-dependent methyltransferase n=1 Tax=Neorhizobium petrolearium TaxID=515361 RepID=A0ABY8M2V2_9HYPH|nr:class I SAM-dependent methyltransferase [Neorhizobium petrolearium]MCC2608521.1 class I SAM-dependent methyltransferase [Neorhizobium petrolearium]WGI68789.1 class I SAM-dependent methyltransferase [Neorhizobium petrolearium]